MTDLPVAASRSDTQTVPLNLITHVSVIMIVYFRFVLTVLPAGLSGLID
jgi:hypothetical protein